MLLIGGVHRDEHGADLRGRPERDVPRRYVRRPDGDLAARPHAHRDERAGEGVHVVTELLVGARVVEGRVAERVLVGERVHHRVEDLREREVDELVLLPQVHAGRIMVGDEGALVALRVVEALHVVDEVGEDDLRVGEVVHPPGLPLERDETVVVDGRERAHEVLEGRGALPHQVVGAVVVRVAHVHVLDVGAQVLDGDAGLLLAVTVRVVHVPQRPEVIARILVEQRGQARRVGVDATRLDEQDDALFLGVRQCGGYRRTHGVLVFGLGLHADVGAGHGSREVDELADLAGVLARLGDVERGVDSGNRKLLGVQAADGRAHVVGVERRAFADERVVSERVVQLDALEVHLDGEVDQLVPRIVGPASHGKRQSH